MVSLKEIITRLAPASEPVLVTGETGTGKEVIARAFHTHSDRSKEPFVAINMACLPSELIESQLFGHVVTPDVETYLASVGKLELARHIVIISTRRELELIRDELLSF